MVTSGYPVEPGLAVSLARPGGNVTGNSSYAGGEVFAKHLSLIREVKPAIPRMGVLWDSAPSAFEPRDGERPLLVDHPTRAFVFA
jgi:putative tryptophan/tyrosine transport system substrate-binding protein